jgi:8-oxo-dGTP diphosphatase
MDEIMVAVGAVVDDNEGRILLVKHVPERKGYWQGKWICPGGSLKLGESIEQGVAREVMEETSLQVSLITQLPTFERIVKSNGKTTLHVIYIDFLARLAGGKFQPGSDVGEGIWVSPEDLSKIWNELHEDTQKLLNLAKVLRNIQ